MLDAIKIDRGTAVPDQSQAELRVARGDGSEDALGIQASTSIKQRRIDCSGLVSLLSRLPVGNNGLF